MYRTARRLSKRPETRRAMIEGRLLLEQVAQKVEGKTDEDDQDGRAQSSPEQARHFVGESRARTHGEPAAQLLGDRTGLVIRNWPGQTLLVRIIARHR